VSYEEQRQRNIERNQNFLSSLGILPVRGLVVPQQAKCVHKEKKKSTKLCVPELGTPKRQSCRLKGVVLPNYKEPALNETVSLKKGSLVKTQTNKIIVLMNEKEFYTVSHIDALCEGPKIPYDEHSNCLLLEDRPGKVGRYRKDTGTEIAKTSGKTCHWCRQKDTSPKTSCGKCNNSQGIICGPCLQGRYGENIFEIIGPDFVDSSWTCPACRDICNCSAATCLRQKRGWGATGALVSRAFEGGYQSVAHYLILGKCFDSVAMLLEAAIQDRDKDALEFALSKASKMELETDPRDRKFGKGSKQRQVQKEDDRVLFCYGASALEVVQRLRLLQEEGRALLAKLSVSSDESCKASAFNDGPAPFAEICHSTQVSLVSEGLSAGVPADEGVEKARLNLRKQPLPKRKQSGIQNTEASLLDHLKVKKRRCERKMGAGKPQF